MGGQVDKAVEESGDDGTYIGREMYSNATHVSVPVAVNDGVRVALALARTLSDEEIRSASYEFALSHGVSAGESCSESEDVDGVECVGNVIATILIGCKRDGASEAACRNEPCGPLTNEFADVTERGPPTTPLSGPFNV